MIKELINKLKGKKQELEALNVNNLEKKDEKNFSIDITRFDNIIKVEISDYIPIGDYVDYFDNNDNKELLELINNSVLWNSRKEMVNKGPYYIIKFDNKLYNFLIKDNIIKIDERIYLDFDEEYQKKNIIKNKYLSYDIEKDDYHYCSMRHDEFRSTYYQKYYRKDKKFSMGSLDLAEENAIKEINELVYNLENISNLSSIIDINFIKQYILSDLNDKYKKIRN